MASAIIRNYFRLMKSGLSIIIFGRNAVENDLYNCLSAIANQVDMPNYEIILLSDYDRVYHIHKGDSLISQLKISVQRIHEDDDNCILFFNAVKSAKYDYLMLLDEHTQLLPFACKDILAYAEANKVKAVFSKGIINVPSDCRIQIHNIGKDQEYQQYTEYCHESYISLYCTLLKKDAINIDAIMLHCKNFTLNEVFFSLINSSHELLLGKCGLIGTHTYCYSVPIRTIGMRRSSKDLAVSLSRLSKKLEYIGNSFFLNPIHYLYLKGHLDMLRKKLDFISQRIYEDYLQKSEKKCLFIISTISLSSQYGIGTYVDNLSRCFNNDEWDIVLLSIGAKSQQIQFTITDIASYYIPCPMTDAARSWEDIEYLYDTGVFCYFADILKNKKKLFCHVNVFSNRHLVKLFKSELNARIVFCVHYTRWRQGFNGNLTEIRRILQKPRTLNECRIQKMFNEEKELFLNYCDAIIAVAKHSYDVLTSLYNVPKSKISLIYHNVNAIFSNMKDICSHSKGDIRQLFHFNQDDIILIFAGRIEGLKGIYDLISTFIILSKKEPKLHLIIAGDGNYSDAVKLAYPVWNRVHFLGFTPQNDLRKLFIMSDIGIVPSKYEEFGYVAIEMLYSGLMVVARDTGGLREIVKDRGVLFGNGKSLKEAIEESLVKISNRESDSCEINLTTYSFDRFKQSIDSLYKGLM